jgi:hypothetical protein
VLLEKRAELRHALAAAAHDAPHAAKLAAKLVGGGSFLVRCRDASKVPAPRRR